MKATTRRRRLVTAAAALVVGSATLTVSALALSTFSAIIFPAQSAADARSLVHDEELQAATAHTLPALGPLPSVPIPADNPASVPKIELGRLLFFDPRLSGDASTSCASCHIAQHGWTHFEPLAPGYPGHRLWRNNPTVLNAAHFDRLMWDGTIDRLEVQARSAMQAPVEGNGRADIIEMRLRLVPEYVDRFHEVFGTEWPQLDDVWRAIAAFERTLVSDPQRVPLDRFILGDERALTPAAHRGYRLFTGKAGCIACHYGPLVSDQQYHALGVPRQPLFDSSPLVQVAVRWQNAQRDAPRALYQNADEDLGRWYQTRDPADIGRFRTPSLRELRYTGPYMHNGVFATLLEVVEFFDRGAGDAPNKSPLLRPLGLTDTEKSDLVAFLESMSMDDPLIMATPALPAMLPLVDLPEFVRESGRLPDHREHPGESAMQACHPACSSGEGANEGAVEAASASVTDSRQAPPRIRYNRYTHQVQRP